MSLQVQLRAQLTGSFDMPARSASAPAVLLLDSQEKYSQFGFVDAVVDCGATGGRSG